jgi:fluoride exporter
MSWKILVAIAVGGGIGTIIRYGLTELLAPPTPLEFDWLTMSINVSGAFVLAAVNTLLTSTWRRTVYVRPFLAVGMIGGNTTWSHFIIESNQLISDGYVTTAVAYLALSLILGLLSAAASSADTRPSRRTSGRRWPFAGKAPTWTA